jgi:hypothetical protein
MSSLMHRRHYIRRSAKGVFVVFALCFAGNVLSQGNAGSGRQPLDPSRFFFGGNFGVRFGDFTFVNISPQVGYRFTERLSAGGGVNFISSSTMTRTANGDRLMRQGYGYAGLNLFGRVFPVSNLFVNVQPEMNYSWGRVRYYTGQADVKTPGAFVPVLLVGAGAAIPTGRGQILAMYQYDLIGNERSPYGRRPFFTFGFNF